MDRLCNEESDHFYAITSGRPALDQCTEEDFEKDLVGFWTFLGEHNRADMIRLQRIQWCVRLPSFSSESFCYVATTAIWICLGCIAKS